MAETPGAPSPPAPNKTGEPRYIVLLLLTIFGATVGAFLVGFAFAALLSFLPSAVGFVLGLALFGLGLPLFLALRAAAALKRKGRGPLLRRLVVMGLIGATQLACFGVVMQYTSRTSGHLAMAAYEVLDVVGGIPFLSEQLFAIGDRQGVASKKPKPTGTPGPDGGVLAADGGVFSADGGIAAPADGGIAGVVDAGPAAVAVPTSARLPAPPRAKPGIPVSPRVAGTKAARVFAAGVQTVEGDSLLVVGTVAAGGGFTARTIDLAAFDKLGEVTLVECADDGTAAAILGGAHLVVARAGKGAELVKALEPGQKLGDLEIQSVHDVLVGPGGAGLAILDLLAGGGEVSQALVTLPQAKTPATVLRKGGDKVPGSATDATVAKSWSFKKSSGAGTVLVVESYLEGGDDLAPKLSGEQWSVNPQRLLVVKLDAPKALVELVRTGLEPSGIAGMELQIFGDAWLLPDGRALFDANFLDKGADGWLFMSKSQSGIFALAPEKRASDDAPWGSAPPRLRGLEANADGTFVFRRDDGAAVMATIDRPTEATAALLGADALATDGKKLGTILGVDVPLLSRGNEWLIASVQLSGASGVVHEAVVLSSRADVQNGKAEVLLEVGGKLPDAPAAKPRTVQSLRFYEGRDELLWQK